VSSPCEWNWAHVNVVFAENYLNMYTDCPSPGLFAAPYLEPPELSLISYVKPMHGKYLAFEARTGTG
jgi:hypothetical protein